MCEKHPKSVCGKTPKELARLVASMHYESLVDFYVELSRCLARDSVADFDRNRPKLADALLEAGVKTVAVAEPIYQAWQISKPFMKGKNE